MELIITLALLLVGYVTGSTLERRHYASIEKRERETVGRPSIPSELVVSEPVELLGMATGSCVISVDYFKRFLAGLRNIFGGNAGAYETLMDRARREAILRMKDDFPNADMFLNVKLTTARIGGGERSGGTVCVEVCAYGTAVRRRR